GAIRCNINLGLPDCMGEESQFLYDLKGQTGQYIYVPDASVLHRVRSDQVTPEWTLDRMRVFGITQTRVKHIRAGKAAAPNNRMKLINEYLKYIKYQCKSMYYRFIGNRSKYFRYKYKSKFKSGVVWELKRMSEQARQKKR